MVELTDFYVDNITKSSARLNADIETSEEVSVVFEYKRVSEEEWIEVDKGTIDTDTLVQHELEGLEELKNYEFRVVIDEVEE